MTAKPNIFKSTLQAAQDAGVVPHTNEARQWFSKKVSNIIVKSPAKLIKESKNKRKKLPGSERAVEGHIWTYRYKPKGAKSLPYYDNFPLTLVVKVSGETFEGLNFHYLPIRMRFQLLKALSVYRIEAQAKVESSEYLRVTYDILKMTQRLKAFKPCYKKYLYSHVVGRYVKILPNEWDLAIALPTYKFINGRKDDIWKDSRSIINGKSK